VNLLYGFGQFKALAPRSGRAGLWIAPQQAGDRFPVVGA
jgi:hypothetical protein